MSIRGRTFTSGKKCFSYCGHDRCDCDAHPDAQGWLIGLADVTSTGCPPSPGKTSNEKESEG